MKVPQHACGVSVSDRSRAQADPHDHLNGTVWGCVCDARAVQTSWVAVRQLEVETSKLVTEREILRRAAKYFTGETGW